MPKIANQNWIFDDDNTQHARKAVEVLRRAKRARAGRKYIRIIVSDNPLTIIEKEDPNGQYLYGKRKSRK